MDLNNVCWIGGPARSGKTSISNRFAGNNVMIYHADDVFMGELVATKEKQPHLWALRNDGPYGILQKPLEECVQVWLDIYKETFDLIKNNIINLETSDITIVEGICLLPDLLHSSGISNACFLISPQDFFEKELAKLSEFQSDMQAQNESKLITDNVSAMMKVMRTYIEEKAIQYEFNIIPVDNEHSLDNNFEIVAKHFLLPLT